MQPQKLYYTDPLLRQFTARVTGCEARPGGYAVTLEATAFYPEGGGQACDLGTLGGVRVLEVQEQGENVVHLCEGPLTVGETVEGRLDWERRFDLMQQHTGEHILSGLIHSRFGHHNVGFHMGTGAMEVDFDGPLTPEQLEQLEAQANAIVWENRPVECSYPEEAALEKLSYRSKKRLPWPVRIVHIPGADTCACCGVHVPFTGMVGLIKVLSVTKFHQGVRLELVCGRRALDYLTAVHSQNRQVAQLFSAKPLETAQAARQTAEALNQERFRANGLQNRLLELIAQSYVNQTHILHFEPDLDGGQLRRLCELLTHRCAGVAAVFTPREQGFGYCLGSAQQDLRPLCHSLNEALQGRGGGKPHFQQGSLQADRQAIEVWWRQAKKGLLSGLYETEIM